MDGKNLFVDFGISLGKLFTIIVIATIAVVLKLIVESRKRKITVLNAFISWLAAVGICYLFFPYITKNASPETVPLWLTFVVLVGDKATTYIVERFNVDIFIKALINKIIGNNETSEKN